MNTAKIYRTQVDIEEGVIDFGIGQPGLDILPREILENAAAHRLKTNDATFLNYGYNAGDGYFLIELARFLEPHYQKPVDPLELFVTAGSSQGLDLVCTQFTQPGDVVIVEEPTYFLAHQIFKDHGLITVGVEMEQDGIDLQDLEIKIKRCRPKMVYVIPAFQNPTGYSLSMEKASKLAELSKKYDFIVVADEVYQLLNFSMADQPPPLANFINDGNILSLGTFSKILAPGLRLGWIQTNKKYRSKLQESGYVISGGSVNHFTTAIIRSVLETGQQESFLNQLKTIYSSRISVMHDALQELIPQAKWQRPDGGFFFWLDMGEGFDATTANEQAEKQKIGFQPGSVFTTDGSLNHFIRLSFAYYGEQDIRTGIEKLAAVLNSA